MNIKLNPSEFIFDGSKKFNIDKSKTKVDEFYHDKSDYAQLSEEYAKEIDELQSMMYAHNRYGLLCALNQ